MEAGSDTQMLIELLDETAALLRKHRETFWAQQLQRDAEGLRQYPLGANGLLSHFGGMGSFTDLMLCRRNGHSGTDAELAAADRELDRLRARMHDLARHQAR